MELMQRPRFVSRSPSGKLLFKTVIFLAVMILFGSFSAVFMRQGMEHVHLLAHWWNPKILLQLIVVMLTKPALWLGIGTRIISALAFIFMLSWADYSFVNPASSISYAITVLMGWLMLGEAVPTGRWIGSIIIGVGVLLIGRTPTRTTPSGEKEGLKGALQAVVQPLELAETKFEKSTGLFSANEANAGLSKEKARLSVPTFLRPFKPSENSPRPNSAEPSGEA